MRMNISFIFFIEIKVKGVRIYTGSTPVMSLTKERECKEPVKARIKKD